MPIFLAAAALHERGYKFERYAAIENLVTGIVGRCVINNYNFAGRIRLCTDAAQCYANPRSGIVARDDYTEIH